jgi:hypothetical protein
MPRKAQKAQPERRKSPKTQVEPVAPTINDDPTPRDPGVSPLFLPNQHVDVFSHEPPEWSTPQALANRAALAVELRKARLAGFRSPTGEPIPPTEPLISIATQLEALETLREEKIKGNAIMDGCHIGDLIELLTLQLAPVFAHERFRAYCNAKHGSYPTAMVVRKLIGSLILEHDFSEDKANRALLDEALDIVVGQRRASEQSNNDVKSMKPHWDKANKTLSYGGKDCIIYKRTAHKQFALLDDFEKSGWPHSIRSPFGDDQDTFRQTVNDLKSKLSADCPIGFEQQNLKLVWKLRDEQSAIPR